MQLTQNAPIDRNVYTVTQLTREIKAILESSFPILWIEAEISNLRKHSSGHMYFVLKDENTQIPAVMWRSRNVRLLITPQDGMKVLVQGCVTVYEKRGNYQFEVLQLQPAGIGELQLAFEQLKSKLHQDGLFAEEHKQQIPKYPDRIGVITSPTGAALRDMVSVFSRRSPSIQLILVPVLVQGEGAAQEIVRAIRLFNQFGDVDLLIIGRGGGSLEDLWPFNEESVARAIYQSELPIISAVGHEIDFCISDFVADLRAPTPSAAAELAAPAREELAESIRNCAQRMTRALAERMSFLRDKTSNLQSSYALRRPVDVVHHHQQRLDDLTKGLEMQFSHKVETSLNKVKSLERNLISLSPQSILSRGYSLCFNREGELVNSADSLTSGEKVKIQFDKGRASAEIDKIEPGLPLGS